MNILDRQEYNEFLNILHRDMPEHSPTHARIPHHFGAFPKNLMEYSAEINNNFLNKNQHLIEEIRQRDPNHPLQKWFKQYQIRYFKAHGGLAHDNFFKASFDDRLKHMANGILGGEYIIFGKIKGATVTIGSQSVTVGLTTGTLYAIKSTGTPTNNAYYDQIAIDYSSIGSGGNHRLGAYTDNSGNPNTILSQSGDVAAATGFPNVSITEYLNTVSVFWFAVQTSNNQLTVYNSVSGTWNIGSYSYGAFPSPVTTSNNGTRTFHMSLSHS